jgi:hypothetical protein
MFVSGLHIRVRHLGQFGPWGPVRQGALLDAIRVGAEAGMERRRCAVHHRDRVAAKSLPVEGCNAATNTMKEIYADGFVRSRALDAQWRERSASQNWLRYMDM